MKPAKTYDRQTGKFLAVVAENMPDLSGMIMQGWIQHPAHLRDALRKTLLVERAEQAFPTWMRLHMTYSRSTLLLALASASGWEVHETALELINKMDLSTSSRVIELVQVNVRDLGLEEASRPEIYAYAKQFGFELVPAQTAAELSLLAEMKDPLNLGFRSNLLMAMEPIADNKGDLHVFRLTGREYGKWLGTDRTSKDNDYDTREKDYYDTWIFARPLKS